MPSAFERIAGRMPLISQDRQHWLNSSRRQQFYADRLAQTMRESAEAAEKSGLTEEKLAELLDDKKGRKR